MNFTGLHVGDATYVGDKVPGTCTCPHGLVPAGALVCAHAGPRRHLLMVCKEKFANGLNPNSNDQIQICDTVRGFLKKTLQFFKNGFQRFAKSVLFIIGMKRYPGILSIPFSGAVALRRGNPGLLELVNGVISRCLLPVARHNPGCKGQDYFTVADAPIAACDAM